MKKLKQKIKDRLGDKKTATLRKLLRVARIVKNVVCWALAAVLTLAIITFMLTKMSGDTPSVFGYSIHRVVSGSMEPELDVSDVIINQNIKGTSEVHVGDIITFQGDSRFDNQKVTHRVLVAPYDDGKGNTVLVTKGDANEVDDGEINFNDVESKYLAKANFLKHIYGFFFSQWGLVVFILLLLLIFFDEIVNIIRITVSSYEQEQPETIYEVIERMQREQREEAEQQRLLVEKAEQKRDAKLAAKEARKAKRTSKTALNAEAQPQEQQKEKPKNKQSKSTSKEKSKVQKNKQKNKSNKKPTKSNKTNYPTKKKSKKRKKR